MSISLNEVLRTLKEIIQEVGDLNKLDSYDYSGIADRYEFAVNDKIHVDVGFTRPYQEDEISALNLPDSATRLNTYNISYMIDGVDTQVTKSDYSTLIRILKTVSDIIVKWLQKNEESVQALTIFAANKKATRYLISADKQKSKIYQAIIIKNLERLPGNWKFKPITNPIYTDIEGIALYKD